jgi:hypothetical protein
VSEIRVAVHRKLSPQDWQRHRWDGGNGGEGRTFERVIRNKAKGGKFRIKDGAKRGGKRVLAARAFACFPKGNLSFFVNDNKKEVIT